MHASEHISCNYLRTESCSGVRVTEIPPYPPIGYGNILHILLYSIAYLHTPYTCSHTRKDACKYHLRCISALRASCEVTTPAISQRDALARMHILPFQRANGTTIIGITRLLFIQMSCANASANCSRHARSIMFVVGFYLHARAAYSIVVKCGLFCTASWSGCETFGFFCDMACGRLFALFIFLCQFYYRTASAFRYRCASMAGIYYYLYYVLYYTIYGQIMRKRKLFGVLCMLSV